jgi:hypothetical protein
MLRTEGPWGPAYHETVEWKRTARPGRRNRVLLGFIAANIIHENMKSKSALNTGAQTRRAG